MIFHFLLLYFIDLQIFSMEDFKISDDQVRGNFLNAHESQNVAIFMHNFLVLKL